MERLTIDEAIAFCHEKSSNIKLKAEPEVFIQLAEWLEELKMLRELKAEHRKIGNIEGFNKGYNKAIDNFAEKLHHEEFDNEYGVHIVLTPQQVDEIAEQLKERD